MNAKRLKLLLMCQLHLQTHLCHPLLLQAQGAVAVAVLAEEPQRPMPVEVPLVAPVAEAVSPASGEQLGTARSPVMCIAMVRVTILSIRNIMY